MLMKFRNLLMTLVVVMVWCSASFAQGLVRGVVQDHNTNETLIRSNGYAEREPPLGLPLTSTVVFSSSHLKANIS